MRSDLPAADGKTDSPPFKLITFWQRPLFTIDGTTYHAIDAALAAMVRGNWPLFERRLAEGLACQSHADRAGRVPDDAAVDAAADAFRYERDLISADEINTWLDTNDVSAEEWQAYLVRELLRRDQRPLLDDLIEQYPASSRLLAEAAFVEGVCSGTFDEFGRAFAGRAALVAAEGSRGDGPAVCEAVERAAHMYAHWLSWWPADDARARLRTVVAIESAFDAATATLVSPARIAETIERHKLEWRRIETDTLSLPAEPAAREALLCVSVDRLSLHDVGALCRRPALRQVRFYDEIDPELGDRLAGLDAGAAIGPVAANGGYEVSVVVGCRWPSPDDPEVAARARRVLVDAATRRAALDRVHPIGPP